MDSPICINDIRMGLSVIYLKGSQVAKIPNFDAFLSLKLLCPQQKVQALMKCSIILRLHCLPKYPRRRFPNTKGQRYTTAENEQDMKFV